MFKVLICTLVLLGTLTVRAESETEAFNRQNIRLINSSYIIRKTSLFPTVRSAQNSILKNAKDSQQYIEILKLITQEIKISGDGTDDLSEVLVELLSSSDYVSNKNVNQKVVSGLALLQAVNIANIREFGSDVTQAFNIYFNNIAKNSENLGMETLELFFTKQMGAVPAVHATTKLALLKELSKRRHLTFEEAVVFATFAQKEIYGFDETYCAEKSEACRNVAEFNYIFLNIANQQDTAKTIEYCSLLMKEYASGLTIRAITKDMDRVYRGAAVREYNQQGEVFTSPCIQIINTNLDTESANKLYSEVEKVKNNSLSVANREKRDIDGRIVNYQQFQLLLMRLSGK